MFLAVTDPSAPRSGLIGWHGSMLAAWDRLNGVKSLGITAYHIQNILKAYHRRLRAKRIDDPSAARGSAEGLVGMGRSTRQEIERQVASQIRQRLILRTFKE
jgi:hypothetical protein